ncbi:MAG: metal ABC transporter ATP-binding protein [Rhodococcus sp.]|nr:metal ABC transporter ATP-binding protein [Rhodococcus sp. (in: high G+C Gram-positive bacteria)]
MIVISELVVRYGRDAVLDNVDARFERGTVTALMGPNGSGKSTLLQVLAGVVAPRSGVVTGVPESVAYVPQRRAVGARLPLTARDVVAMGRWEKLGLLRRPGREGRKVVDDALHRLGVSDLAHRRLTSLSGGQCQRVLLAQALVQRGRLVLLDEPTAGLDAHATRVISDITREEAARGATVVVATHDALEAARADQVIELGRYENESSEIRASSRSCV